MVHLAAERTILVLQSSSSLTTGTAIILMEMALTLTLPHLITVHFQFAGILLLTMGHHHIMEDLHTTSPITTAQMMSTGLIDQTSITGQITRMVHMESLQDHPTEDLKEITQITMRAQSMVAHLTTKSQILMDLIMENLLEITAQNTMKDQVMKVHHTIRSLSTMVLIMEGQNMEDQTMKDLNMEDQNTEGQNTGAQIMKVHLPMKSQILMDLITEDLLAAVITHHLQITNNICKEVNHHSMDHHTDVTMVSPKLYKSSSSPPSVSSSHSFFFPCINAT